MKTDVLPRQAREKRTDRTTQQEGVRFTQEFLTQDDVDALAAAAAAAVAAGAGGAVLASASSIAAADPGGAVLASASAELRQQVCEIERLEERIGMAEFLQE
jgi:Tfp pilus assembly protein PilN